MFRRCRSTLRQTAVFLSAVIYWGGVMINAWRVRRNIGRSPNLRPKTFRERLLWVSWLIIISGWAGQPLLIERFPDSMLFSFIENAPLHSIGILNGILLILSGYAGTLWCYRSLGDSWRIGVNRKERTVLVQNGPYRLVRHPIYLFQVIILIGVTWLLPTLFSLIILAIHFISIHAKAIDEEAHLIRTHGIEYKEYNARTGRFLPKIFR
jgi:protein-S-isoprenylcysteine O-methyltransferase Ste14